MSSACDSLFSTTKVTSRPARNAASSAPTLAQTVTHQIALVRISTFTGGLISRKTEAIHRLPRSAQSALVPHSGVTKRHLRCRLTAGTAWRMWRWGTMASYKNAPSATQSAYPNPTYKQLCAARAHSLCYSNKLSSLIALRSTFWFVTVSLSAKNAGWPTYLPTKLLNSERKTKRLSSRMPGSFQKSTPISASSAIRWQIGRTRGMESFQSAINVKRRELTRKSDASTATSLPTCTSNRVESGFVLSARAALDVKASRT